MAQVSVGQVENLEEAVAGLQAIYALLETSCQTQIIKATKKLDEVQQEYKNSVKLCEIAIEDEKNAYQKFEQMQETLSDANQRYISADSALIECEESGYEYADGNYIPPNCTFYEAELITAENIVAETKSLLAETEKTYEKEKTNRILMEQRKESSQQCLNKALLLVETIKTECATRLANSKNHLDAAVARLQKAKDALNEYLQSNPAYREFYEWLKWQPKANTPITPKDIHSRLNLSVEQQKYYLQYLAERDSKFRANIAKYRNQLAANGEAERNAIQRQMRINFSGYCAEKIVEKAFAPLGERVVVQFRTTVENGKVTITDIIIEGLKVPVILGRGKGMSVKIGGSIAIEVKSGRASYLYSQEDHMVFQSKGHKKADASITICTHDIKDLSPAEEEELRKALRDAGSPLIGMLPKKNEIDKACWELVNGKNETNGGTNEN